MIKNNIINFIKKLIMSLIIVSISFLPIMYSRAEGFDFGKAMSSAKEFISNGSEEAPEGFNGYEDLQESSTAIGNVLMIIGMGIAIVIAGILGIQFMLGSVEQRAQVKDKAIPFLIGCLVVFGAFGIWKMVITILKGATT